MNARSLLKSVGARVQHGLHDHLHRDPGGPVGSRHVAAVGLLFEPRVNLRRAVMVPVPGDRLEVDAADHRPRPHKMIGHGASEIEIAIGDEHDIEIAVDGAH